MIRDLLEQFLGSKKAVVFILSLVAMGLARAGWDVEAEQLYLFVAPVIAYLLGQGLADLGKSSTEAILDAKELEAAMLEDPLEPSDP